MPFDRRDFLAASGALAAAADGREAKPTPLPVPEPKATSGDAVEPAWAERYSVTVGPKSGDLVGTSQRVIQAAIELVSRMGGGTVKLLAGTYRLRDAVRLRSGVRLVGAGDDTVLIKEPSRTAKLAKDSDWYDGEITLADAAGFEVGDGVCLRAKNAHHSGDVVIKRTLVARTGNRFKLDRPLRENLWLAGTPTASTLFALLDGDGVENVAIESLCLDGNRANNANLDGNYAGCVFLQDCNRVSLRKVTARNYNGDGVSWQICHDVSVEDCRSHDNAGLGLHPGSGSQRPRMLRNRIEGNDIGIFFCWGVRGGLAEGNFIKSNRGVGVSIGHRDTDNLVRDNDIVGSGKTGILFRPERGKSYAPHRNRFEGNRVTDSGGEAGAAIDLQGEVDATALVGNVLRETRGPAKRVGIRIGAKVVGVEMKGNTAEGFAREVEDLRR